MKRLLFLITVLTLFIACANANRHNVNKNVQAVKDPVVAPIAANEEEALPMVEWDSIATRGSAPSIAVAAIHPR